MEPWYLLHSLLAWSLCLLSLSHWGRWLLWSARHMCTHVHSYSLRISISSLMCAVTAVIVDIQSVRRTMRCVFAAILIILQRKCGLTELEWISFGDFSSFFYFFGGGFVLFCFVLLLLFFLLCFVFCLIFLFCFGFFYACIYINYKALASTGGMTSLERWHDLRAMTMQAQNLVDMKHHWDDWNRCSLQAKFSDVAMHSRTFLGLTW